MPALTLGFSLLIPVLLLGLPTRGGGQPPPPPRPPGPPGVHFFACPEVRFFEPCRQEAPARPEAAAGPPTSQAPASAASLFTEVLLTPQGPQVYTPPAPLLTLLEEPTEANARAFLEWHRARVNRIQAAQRVLAQVTREAAGPPKRPARILAFVSPRCPYSRQLLPALATLAREGAPITGIAVDASGVELEQLKRTSALPLRGDQGEADRLGITGTPTLVLLDQAGQEQDRQVGLLPEDRLRQVVQGDASPAWGVMTPRRPRGR